jgi:hypothetical protein
MKPTYETRKPLIRAGQGGVSKLTLCETINWAPRRTSMLDSALIGGVGGVAGAIVSIFAAVAAWRSAGSAKQATVLAARQIEQAARQQRESLLREANALAHRAAVTATRVEQLAQSVPTAYRSLLALAGRSVQASGPNPVQTNTDQRCARAQEVSQTALKAKGAIEIGGSDADLSATIRRMDEFLIELEALKEAISKELEMYASESRMLRQQNEARMMAAGGRVAPPITRA